ncbi:MAG: hypothetical protein LCH56_03330 [Proteobacteria bacterium]|nr:hypothetical protein [Pseudomonadota bacterium]
MRRFLSLAFIAALIGGGLYVLYFEMFLAAVIRGQALAMAGFLFALGVGWLWGDFVLPALRSRRTS